MRLLYVFPHPDDESFGPALAIAAQHRAGDEVYLLTLTRGGATKQRHRLGLSVDEMGRIRHDEMKRVADVLALDGMTVLDFPDSGLAEMDPRVLERAVREHVRMVAPDILVTYAVHGVSGFPDHLVTHAVVKRVYCELSDADDAGSAPAGFAPPRRLALFTLAEEEEAGGGPSLKTSPEQDIDCAIAVGTPEIEAARAALACYETYQEVIREHDPLGRVGRTVYFEIFQESHEPPLPTLSMKL